MKKLFMLLAVLFFMAGCQTNKLSKTRDKPSTNVYINENKDGRNVSTERIYKDYKITDPKELFEEADYCLIGNVEQELETVIYDEDGKIKTHLEIKVKEVLKGELGDKIELFRDGGMATVAQYLEYEGKDLMFSKNMLTSVTSKDNRDRYTVEVVPAAYFTLELDRDYLFFVKDNNGELEILNDAYGMLKVKNKNIENLYTDEVYSIDDIKNK